MLLKFHFWLFVNGVYQIKVKINVRLVQVEVASKSSKTRLDRELVEGSSLSFFICLLGLLIHGFYDCRVRSPGCRSSFSIGGILDLFAFHHLFLRSCSVSASSSCHSTTHMYRWNLEAVSYADDMDVDVRAQYSVLHQLRLNTRRFYLLLVSVVVVFKRFKTYKCNKGLKDPNLM
ncbi:hypothetical protein RND81_05G063700 [Saponaria officinalis]|uniref:Transmembrane protein n=1 Tax=Saponaria officinalis TaxID=3572 RepID=A0AAW1KV24_SAPOF